MVSIRSGDDRDFMNRAPFDKKSLNGYKKGFKAIVQDEVDSPFDMGYFMAWSDLIRYKHEDGES